MSLIQDALKRQQEEMNKKAGAESPQSTPAAEQPPAAMAKMPLRMMNQPSFAHPETPAATPAASPVVAPPASASNPPPLPPAKESISKPTAHTGKAAVEEPEKAVSPVIASYDESRRPKALVPVLIAAILLFAVGFYYGWPLLQNALKKSPPGSSIASPAPLPPDGSPVAVIPQAGAAVQASADSKPGAVDFSNAVAKATPSKPTQPVNPAAPATTNGIAPPAESNDYPVANIAKPTLDLEPPPKLFVQAPKTMTLEPVVWPPLKFTGCINMGTSALAIINGQMVEPGQKIEDVLLVTVSRNEALIRLGGEERTLRVGETAR